MYQDKQISIVVPCYNEEKQVGKVLAEMPDFIDHIVVIDDMSTDATVSRIEEYSRKDKRIVLIRHEKNKGVGGAIASGYKWARDNNSDIAVVMAGDGQMDPVHLPDLIRPVANGEVDYTKTNRLMSGKAFEQIPRIRYLGNSILSLLTKIASGYWHIADSQSGYTAIGKKALHLVDWDRMYKRYGQPNDLLVRLNIYNMKVRDIYTEPVYNVGEVSKLKIWKVVFTLSFLLFKRFLFRMREKYIIRDFHPLIFFYSFGFLLLLTSVPLFVRVIYFWIAFDHIPKVNFLAWMLCVIMSVQFIFFAMWFDMESNKDLK